MSEQPGRIDGTFEVDANGGATYSIPLRLPPGTAGLQPRLSLVYNNHLTDFGFLGVGWRLQGLSSISRVPATMAQDRVIGRVEFGPNDRFAFDGARLMAVSGTYGAADAVYHTELQQWMKVEPKHSATAGRSGPDSFVAQSKDRTVYEFGQTPDSQLLANAMPGKPANPTVRAWLVNRITDRNGNFIVFRYEQDAANNAIYPKTIEYTGNGTNAPTRRVEFKYTEIAEESADAAPQAAGGYLTITRRLLESVSTFVANTLVLTYRLTYARDSVTRRSRIVNITVSDREGNTLPATGFEWQNGAPALFASVATPTSIPEHRGSYIPMDVNGDGIIDIVHAYRDPVRRELALSVYIGRGDGTFAPPAAVDPTGLPEGGQLIPLDLDADGCTDLVYARGERSEMLLTVFHAREINGQWTLKKSEKDTGGPAGLRWPATLLAVDFDGDGRIDLVHASGERDKTVIRPLRSNGTSFEHTPDHTTFTDLPWSPTLLALDYDGDGKGDLVLCRSERDRLLVRLLWSDGKRFVPRPADEPLGNLEFTPVVFSMDVNGDGKPDLVAARMHGSTLELRTFLSNGLGLEAPRLKTFQLRTDSMPRLLPARITGSALPDLVIQTLHRGLLNLVVLSSNGQQFVERGDVVQPFTAAWAGASLLPVDVDGDGRSDLLAISPAASDQTKLAFTAARVQGPPPDLICRITDGWGEQARIEYKPLTDSSVYRKGDLLPDGRRSEPPALLNRGVSGSSFDAGTGAASPGTTHGTMDVQFAKYVVSAYERAGTPDQRFRFERLYAGARVDLDGRSWLGFSTLQTTDRTRNTKSLTTYRQEFPFAALQSREERYRLSDGKLLERISYDYRDEQRGVTHEPRLLAKKRALFGGTGPDPDVVESTEYEYDGCSNITLEALSVSGAKSRPLYVRHVFGDIDQANWRLGLEHETKQTADRAGNEVLVHRQYQYDSRANRIVEKVQDAAHNRWLTTTNEYDQFGNRTAVTNPSGARNATQYDSIHHTFVARVIRPANDAGLVLAIDNQHDPGFGIQLEESTPYRNDDASGRAVLWRQTLDGFGRVIGKLAPNPGGVLVPIQKTALGRDGSGAFEETATREDWDGAQWNRERKYQSSIGGTFLTRRTGADGVRETVVERTFDSEGRTVAETLVRYENEPARTIRRTFDELGRLVRMERPLANGGTTIATTECVSSAIETSTEAFGTGRARMTRRQYGYFGTRREIVKRVDALDGTTIFDYDALGRITSGTDPAGVITTARYDFTDRQTLLEVSKGTQVQVRQRLDYDDEARQSTRTDGRGITTVIKRDAMDRIVSKRSEKDGVTTYTYDDPARKNTLSRLASVRMPNGLTYRYDYHPNGNRAELLLDLDGAAYSLRSAFTPSGRLETLHYPDGTRVRHVYNAAGSVVTMKAGDDTTYVTYGQFAAGGRPQLVSFHNGTTERLPYNNVGQLASQTIAGSDGNALAQTSMQWNELYQLERIDDVLAPERTQAFSYDALGRLIRATGDYSELQEFGYDAAGNLTRKGGVQFEVEGYQVRSGVRGNVPVFHADYDGAGNIVACERGGSSDRYQFDADSNLVGANGATFVYDFQGERVVKRTAGGPTTIYIERSFEVTLFPNGSRQQTAYILGPSGLVASRTERTGTPDLELPGVPESGLYFFHTNHINSTTIQTDAGGREVCRVSYLPFGEINKLTGRDFFRQKFSGNELDRETGLYYFHSRYYDAMIGRFISADDQLGDALDRRDVFNRYAYALNNPVSEFDPEGHGTGTWVAVLMGAAFVAGLALSVLTAGVALPLLGATIAGAAASGFMYSVKHQNDFNTRDFGVEVGIGAAVGLTTGVVFGGLTRLAGTAIEVGIGQAAKMSATHFAKVVGIEIAAGFAAGLVGSSTKQAYYNDGRVNASDLFIAGGWSAAGGLASGVGIGAATRAMQRDLTRVAGEQASYGIRPYLGMSDAGRGAVKGAISLPRAVFGMPVKEQGPKLVDRAMKGEL